MVKHRTWWITFTMMVVLAMPWAGLWGQSGSPGVVAQTVDQEIVYLDSAGLIKVHDPTVPAGKEAVVWQSPDNGWVAIATGDFNGDGDDEIIAIKGYIAKVFDPIVQPGWVTVTFDQNVSPYTWELVATGDIDADGRDEIVLTHSDTAPGIKEHLTVWDGGVNGTTWTKIRDNAYGWPWDGLALGDVNGDGRDDIAMIRHVEGQNDRRLTILDPVNWSTLHDKSYDFAWLDLAIGNTDRQTSGERDEIVLTRQDVVAYLDSYLVMRWKSGSTTLEDVHGEKFYPYFTSIALGDVNSSGDDEVFLVRDPERSDGISFIMRNYGTDAVPTFEEKIGRQWRVVVAGDTDGDGRAEAVILSSNEIRIYTSPEVSKAYTYFTGSFRTTGRSPIVLGNLDGLGITPGPTSTPTSTPTPTVTPTITPTPTATPRPFSVSPTAITLTVRQGYPLPYIPPIRVEGMGISWVAGVIPAGGWEMLVAAAERSGKVERAAGGWLVGDGAGAASITDVTWVTLSPDQGTAPSYIYITLDQAGLEPGLNRATIVVDAGPGVSPRFYGVDLTVLLAQNWNFMPMLVRGRP